MKSNYTSLLKLTASLLINMYIVHVHLYKALGNFPKALYGTAKGTCVLAVHNFSILPCFDTISLCCMLSIVVCKILENFMPQLIYSRNASDDYVTVPNMYKSTCSRDVNLKKSKSGE